MKTKIEKKDFLSSVSILDDVAEQHALKILIQKNTALAKKTIWQYIIISKGRQYSELIKKALEEETLELLFSMSDFEAVKSGLTPMSLTQKAKIIALSFRHLNFPITSLDAVGSALKRLVDLGFVTQRDVQNKHTDKLYYVNSQLLILWEKQNQVITESRTASERFWFDYKYADFVGVG